MQYQPKNHNVTSGGSAEIYANACRRGSVGLNTIVSHATEALW